MQSCPKSLQAGRQWLGISTGQYIRRHQENSRPYQACISRKYRRPSPSATSSVKGPLNPWIFKLCFYNPFPKLGWNIIPPRLCTSVFTPSGINYYSPPPVARDRGSLAGRAGQIQHRLGAIGSTDGGILLDDQTMPPNVLHDVCLGRVDYISAARACGRHPLVPHWRRKHGSWTQHRGRTGTEVGPCVWWGSGARAWRAFGDGDGGPEYSYYYCWLRARGCAVWKNRSWNP